VHQVSVAAIMERTTLSRKSFYVYFRDRTQLLEALVRPLRTDTDAAVARWAAADDPIAAGRAALRSAARTYRRRGAVLRALFWSSGEDPDVEAVRRALVEPVVAAAETVIRERVGAHMPHPHAIATALVTMNVHRLLAVTPQTSDDELAAIVDTLAAIWERVLYPAPAVGKFHHVQLACPPGAEQPAREFYCDVLGFTEIPKPAALAARGGCWFRHGDIELHLGVESDFRPARKAHPALLVDNLDSYAQRLATAGLRVDYDTALPGMRRFYCHDPHGNRLEFLQTTT
jgi:catechol 2,3-dioxygenase-like lactoylglutathione lyase family enzyme/AcrR family transcriptional regulator